MAETMIRLGALDATHIAEHNAGEDEHVIRWLSGAPATEASTRDHFAMLARNEARGAGKRGYGVWLDARLAGYIDFELDAAALPAPGDVNLAYFVHPWARGLGVASAAVELVCALLVERRIGRRAVIRTEQGNLASAAVARRCGFTRLTSIESLPGSDAERQLLWVRPLA